MDTQVSKHITIIGGGIAGLSSAYFLQKAGHQITLIDKKSTPEDAATYGNAGLISPFEKMPLANFDIIKTSMKLILQGKSPFIMNPTLDMKVYKWLVRFLCSANSSRVKRTLMLFEKYGYECMDIYDEFTNEANIDLDIQANGLLMAYTEDRSYEKKLKTATSHESLYKVLNQSELEEYLPITTDKIKGGVLLKRNRHLDPALILQNLQNHLEKNGANIINGEEIIDFEVQNGKVVNAVSRTAKYQSDEFVISAGANVGIYKKLGLDLMMIPTKGHSITFEMEEALKPKTSTLFNDLFVAFTPRRDSVRLTGKLEFAASSHHEPEEKLIQSVINALRSCTKEFEMKNPKKWAGVRPLCPNDMPLFGRHERYQNTFLATGLGWQGISFGPVIGKIISTMIEKDQRNLENDDVLIFSGFYS